MRSILILMHTESSVGYAIGPLERIFYDMALELLSGDVGRIFFAYPSMARGPSKELPREFANYLVFDARTKDPDSLRDVVRLIRERQIDLVFGFDQPVHRPLYSYLRKAGVRTFVSYWGAPMSSIFGRFKRAIKRVEVCMRRHGPDLYIFESRGMADTATLGRGIPSGRVRVVHLGVDTNQFRPDPSQQHYVNELLNIPAGRRVFVYAGHMEERKGVRVIIEAVNLLADRRAGADWHVLLVGNRPGEESRFLAMLSPKAAGHVQFGGYRNDLREIYRGCYAAIIASTGWDSFPRSAMEMQASGLPLLASNLPGLNESVVSGETGYLFKTADSGALADAMQRLLDDPQARERFSRAARLRIQREFSLERQLLQLVEAVRDADRRSGRRLG